MDSREKNKAAVRRFFLPSPTSASRRYAR